MMGLKNREMKKQTAADRAAMPVLAPSLMPVALSM